MGLCSPPCPYASRSTSFIASSSSSSWPVGPVFESTLSFAISSLPAFPSLEPFSVASPSSSLLCLSSSEMAEGAGASLVNSSISAAVSLSAATAARASSSSSAARMASFHAESCAGAAPEPSPETAGWSALSSPAPYKMSVLNPPDWMARKSRCRFWSLLRRMFSSMVCSLIRRYMWTSRVCPILWHLSCACASMAGFQSES
mmetsp:Transcript_5126/g.14695  ORF Transcript_5126/g.14695 Transcript_5126/m.14695 type:complete len:202 (-) Transcript_5126:2416-3021(-)